MQIVNAAEIETNSAKMQAMDKITGRVNEIIVPVKSKISTATKNGIKKAKIHHFRLLSHTFDSSLFAKRSRANAH